MAKIQIDISFYMITWVTYNSRLSERMVTILPKKFIKGMTPFVFSKVDQLFIAQKLSEAITKYSLPTVTYNVLPDHVHMIVAINSSKELETKIGNLKGFTSFVYKKKVEMNCNVWAQKFNRQLINTDHYLSNAINYIDNNHIKHEATWGKNNICGFSKEFKEIIDDVCISPEEIVASFLKNE